MNQLRKIAVLDQSTIDKIAAGEVVERPASVVKELVENAIDAGSTAITVEIKEGGISFIRVTDNGSGMDKSQVKLAFLRHATSKIEKVEDLLEIESLGFRGEALSSISAVAQVEMITKTAQSLTGIRYLIEGGMEKGLEEIGAPCGTTILVRNLFFNTPARAKFLKTPVTEAGYVSTYMEQLALSHAHISFKYMVNGQTKLHTSGNANLRDVIYSIYGREITRELIPIQWEQNGIKLDGFAGKPVIARGNRAFENYYINGRYVKSKIIMKAIEDAYKPYMMQHKYPFVCLKFEVPGDEVDINVHPTKMEVRFQKQKEIYESVYEALLFAVGGKELIPEVKFEEKESELKKVEFDKKVHKKENGPEPFEVKRKESFLEALSFGQKREPQNQIREDRPEWKAKKEPQSNNVSVQPDKVKDTEVGVSQVIEKKENQRKETILETVSEEGLEKQAEAVKLETKTQEIRQPKLEQREETKQMELFDDRLLSKRSRKHHRIIGQLFETYWLVEYDEKFYIIDQHAAHEKVLYERFMKEYESKNILSQIISPPQIISLSLQEAELLKVNQKLFEEFGFEISSFGGKEYSISAVPSNLYGVDVEELFLEILGSLDLEGSHKTPDLIRYRIATSACKAAVKGNQTLSVLEADKLIDELLGLENPYHCPHGRPTIVSMTKYELEKKFKRIV